MWGNIVSAGKVLREHLTNRIISRSSSVISGLILRMVLSDEFSVKVDKRPVPKKMLITSVVRSAAEHA